MCFMWLSTLQLKLRDSLLSLTSPDNCFFFSSRRRHTRSLCDWSSDVCSSDLPSQATVTGFHQYDNQLEDFSLAAHQRNRRRLLRYLAAFQAVNPRTLSQLDRDDREIMIATIHSALLEEDRVQLWRTNPDSYSGAVTSSIFSLIKRNFAPPEERLRSVIA